MLRKSIYHGINHSATVTPIGIRSVRCSPMLLTLSIQIYKWIPPVTIGIENESDGV